MENKYSFQEIDNEIRDSFLRTSKVFDERNKLRDNWNNLREWINTRLQSKIVRTGMRNEELLIVLDKMNELERKNK